MQKQWGVKVDAITMGGGKSRVGKLAVGSNGKLTTVKGVQELVGLAPLKGTTRKNLV